MLHVSPQGLVMHWDQAAVHIERIQDTEVLD